jgi:hypothetical protein
MSHTATTAIPYGVIAACFRNHTIVPFLGSAASFAGASDPDVVPGGAAFARLLAEKSGYPGSPSDALTKVAQFLEEVPADRAFLLNEIITTFYDGIPNNYRTSLTNFLSYLPTPYMPRLIITTNYDILVERTFEQLGIPYLALSHIMKGSKYAGRLLCYQSLDEPLDDSTVLPLRKLEEQLHEVATQDSMRVIIYKMHGTSRLLGAAGLLDSVVLTENDYIDFLAQDVLQRIPTMILRLLRSNRLLFLGYSLEDWNFRVLLRRLHMLQQHEHDGHKRHWACLLDADDVEVKFWERRGVNLYLHPLDAFLSQLGEALGGGAS